MRSGRSVCFSPSCGAEKRRRTKFLCGITCLRHAIPHMFLQARRGQCVSFAQYGIHFAALCAAFFALLRAFGVGKHASKTEGGLPPAARCAAGISHMRTHPAALFSAAGWDISSERANLSPFFRGGREKRSPKDPAKNRPQRGCGKTQAKDRAKDAKKENKKSYENHLTIRGG